MDRKSLQEDMQRYFAAGGEVTFCGNASFLHEFEIVEKQLQRDSTGRPFCYKLAVKLDNQEGLSGLLIGFSKGLNLKEGSRYRAHLDPSPNRLMFLADGRSIKIAFGVDARPVLCSDIQAQVQDMPNPAENL